ncbi:MAG TPA: tetratricopeptide repeat protein [Vicinamibacterales bacterium]|nr:tetratricopeptide repeat protein [Acidobacteriota bacterium]HOC17680.1 tetratricopeptide repeat protein [Vicinamibacterales bacterium]
MGSPSAKPASTLLAGQHVAFTGRLFSLSRHDARALVARLGGTPVDDVNAKATVLVVGAAGEHRAGAEAEKEKSRKIRRAEAINARQPGRIRVLTEDQFCELAGIPSPAALRQQWYGLRDILAMYPHLREDHLRYLQKWNLIRPALRTHAETYFSFPDLAVLRQANGDLERGAPLRSVLRSLLASREGQLRLDFHLDAQPARVVRLGARTTAAAVSGQAGEIDAALAEELFLVASSLDDGNPLHQEACARAYRRAIEADPNLVPALINLANVHYARGELVEAETLYQRALTLEDDLFETHFNLGNVYHDLGRLDEAGRCYEAALELNPDYADAHFYLAVTREKQGRSDAARPHWRRYLELAPDGEWVDLAQEFSQ